MLVKSLASTVIFLGCLSMHTAADVERSLAGIKTVAVTVDLAILPPQGEIKARLLTIVELRLQKEGFTLADAGDADALIALLVTASRQTLVNGGDLGWISHTSLEVSQLCRLVRRDDIVCTAVTWDTGLLSSADHSVSILSHVEKATRKQLDEFVNAFIASERQETQSKAKGDGKRD